LKDPDGEDVDVHTYMSMIGSLMYLTSLRPDIMFAVCACARFQVTPTASNLHAVNRIFRYLKSKTHLGLWYPKDLPFNLVAYLDSDYAGASLDRKSTIGGVNTPRCDEDRIEIMELMVNDVIRLQALIDRKKVIITKDTVRQAPYLDGAESIDCLPNEEIFAELARMGYEKPSSKLTFYTAFFSARWKVGKGFFRVNTPLFKGMLVQQQATNDVDDVVTDDVIADVVAKDVVEPTIPSSTPTTPPPPQELPSTSQVAPTPPLSPIAQPSSPPKQPQPSQSTTISMVVDIDVDKDVTLEEVDAVKDAKVVKDVKVTEDDDKPEPAKLKEVIEVVTTTKLMIEVVTAAATTIVIAPITATTINATPRVARRRNGVVIRDPEENATPSTIVHSEPKSKDKGKGILVQEPKPFKKQAQIEQDDAYARELEAELNKNIN
nr:uncharacterized mitochondrial protein AtMg00810-like [Tanacetum cinerariifolium]